MHPQMRKATVRTSVSLALWLCLWVVPAGGQGLASTAEESATGSAVKSKRADLGREGQRAKQKRDKAQKTTERSRSNPQTKRPSLDPAKDLERPPEETRPEKATPRALPPEAAKPDAPITPPDPTKPTTTTPIR
jgi:hypothetical protein